MGGFKLTKEETALWEGPRAEEAEELRREMRAMAQRAANEFRETVEIYSHDGTVFDAVAPDPDPDFVED